MAEFIDLLRAAAVSQVVHVRLLPRSRTNSQYNQEVLGDTLWRRSRSAMSTSRTSGASRKARPQGPVSKHALEKPKFQQLWGLRAFGRLSGGERQPLGQPQYCMSQGLAS
ncbi:MAG: DUF488 family protein [Alphaproteobacteria bacterium]|nr:MAG: DUF488 family protein [Alphaproteobacteria bacterium]